MSELREWAEITMERSSWLELTDAMIGGQLQNLSEATLVVMHEAGVMLLERIQRVECDLEDRMGLKMSWNFSNLIREAQEAL